MIQNIPYEEFEKAMLEDGWHKKVIPTDRDFYPSWYYRMRKKKVLIDHHWHIDHPEVFWYKESDKI